MKLTKVEFTNYKSILTGELDIEHDITCLVGVNESGKSNVLQGLEKADKYKSLINEEYSRHAEDSKDTSKVPELTLWFNPREDELEGLKELFGHDQISEIVIKKVGHASGHEAFSLVHPAITSDNTESILRELVSQYMPLFIRFDSVDFDNYYLPDDSNRGESNIIKNLLSLGGIDTISQFYGVKLRQRDSMLNTVSATINENIFKHTWTTRDVTIQLKMDSGGIYINLKEKSGSEFSPGERSRGFQWALAFNVHFLAKTKGKLKNSVLMIDEPGVFLHIDAQNRLLNHTFPEIVGNGNQIIYTTHLPYLIDSRYPERIRILEKEGESTIIGNKAWDGAEDFGKIPEPVRTALGLRWSELFHVSEKKKNVLVEGPTDQIILRSLLNFLDQNKEGTEITFIPAYSCNNFPRYLGYIKREEKKYFGLLDGDVNGEKMKKIIAECESHSIKSENVDNLINLVGKKDIKEIEDVVPADVFRKAVFRWISSERKNHQLTEEDIPVKYPRVKELKEFLTKNKLNTTIGFNKMKIAREVANILREYDKDANMGEDWNVARDLIEKIKEKFEIKDSNSKTS